MSLSWNLTAAVDKIYQENVEKPIDLFWWNIIQAFIAQPECKVSKVFGTTNLVPQCWDYAWVFRPILMFAISTIFYVLVLGGLVAFTVGKMLMQSSGSYATLQAQIQQDNKENGTTLTFP